MNIDNAFDCFLGPIYIRMDSSCLLDRLASLCEKNRVLRLNIFQELILKRYVRISLRLTKASVTWFS